MRTFPYTGSLQHPAYMLDELGFGPRCLVDRGAGRRNADRVSELALDSRNWRGALGSDLGIE